jgi:hypothetical protein
VLRGIEMNDLEYALIDGGYCVSSWAAEDGGAVIPPSYNGQAVTAIADNAFAGSGQVRGLKGFRGIFE